MSGLRRMARPFLFQIHNTLTLKWGFLMTKIDTVVAVAGWEERFTLGVRRDLDNCNPAELLIFAFEEYLNETLHAREQVSSFAAGRGVISRELQVRRDPLAL